MSHILSVRSADVLGSSVAIQSNAISAKLASYVSRVLLTTVPIIQRSVASVAMMSDFVIQNGAIASDVDCNNEIKKPTPG